LRVDGGLSKPVAWRPHPPSASATRRRA